uniref:BHLH domain-containing protein n=1 Tax=Macrostomum lignano TaxID=282301 RepID=A0A1I8G9F2_9PLAT
MTSSNSASAFASIDLDSLLDEGGSASFQSALRQSDLLFGDIEHSEMALDLRTAARKKKRCPQPTRRSRRLRDSIEQLSLSLANEVGQSALCLLVTLRCRLAGQHCLSIPISSLCR